MRKTCRHNARFNTRTRASKRRPNGTGAEASDIYHYPRSDVRKPTAITTAAVPADRWGEKEAGGTTSCTSPPFPTTKRALPPLVTFLRYDLEGVQARFYSSMGLPAMRAASPGW